MKKIVYAAIALSILISLFLILRPDPLDVESLIIEKGTFEETVASEGKVRSPKKQILYAFATGTMDRLRVKVGDSVQKGQLLARIEWDKVANLTSGIDGVVSKVFRESDGPINRGEPVVEISSLQDLEVVADVLTTDAVRLKQGGSVRISNWGGEQDLKGKILQISRAGTVKTSALGVEEERTDVRISLEEVPEKLKSKLGDNYHVDVVFVVIRMEDALAVPIGSLFKVDEEWALYTIEKRRAVMKKVRTTKRNDRFALIESGLSGGEEVILFPGDRVREGTLVQGKR